MADVQQVVWVARSEVDDVRALAQEHGVTVEEREVVGILPVVLVPLIIIGAAAAVGLVEHEIEVHRGGQVIDLSGQAPKIYRSKDLQYGLIVIIKKDGSVKITVNKAKELFGQVLDAVQKILTDVGKETVDKIADAVKSAVGDKASVEVQPHSVDVAS